MSGCGDIRLIPNRVDHYLQDDQVMLQLFMMFFVHLSILEDRIATKI